MQLGRLAYNYDDTGHDPTTLPSLSSSKAAIDRVYTVLFDLANPALAPKIAVIQNGSALRSAMRAALKSALAKLATGASVSAVTVEHGSACKENSCRVRAPR